MKGSTFMKSVLLFLLLYFLSDAAMAQNLTMGCSDRNWYPFLYTRDQQVGGILYDITRKAFDSLGITPKIESLPFRRAIAYARKGKVDCVIAVPFDPVLARDLDYPPGAENDMESPWRIMQVDYVVVSAAGNNYLFEGNLKTLPVPIRLLSDAPVIDDLNKKGIGFQEVREDEQNFLKLIRDRAGVVITTSVVAEAMNLDPRFRGKLEIHGIPVASRAYYLAFSKRSHLSMGQKEKVWKEIIRWRDDYIFMLQVFSRY